MESLQCSKDILIGQLNGILHRRLVFGLTTTRREPDDTVVVGKALEFLIKNRIVAAGPCYRTLKIVRNDGLRNAVIVI